MTEKRHISCKLIVAFIMTVILVITTIAFWPSDCFAKEKRKATVTVNNKSSDTPVGEHGALSVKKVDAYQAPTIVDEHGKAVQLRTVSTHGVQWFPQYINKDAFQSLRDEWGLNAVRLAVYPREGGYLQGNQALMDQKIQEGVEAAKELGMYIIIDWHVLSYNPNDDLEAAKTFFKMYATKYKKYNNVIFEICNEPTGTPWYNGSGNDLYTYCKTVSKVIRDCGNNSIIICGTNDWSQRVDEVAVKPLKNDGFENIMYSIHFYAATHYDDIKNHFRNAIASGTPVFASEFGCCDASGNGGYDFENANDWMRLFAENNVSYACWSLCNKAESASCIASSCTKTDGWTESDLTESGLWLVRTSRAFAEGDGSYLKTFNTPTVPEKTTAKKGCESNILVIDEWNNGFTANGTFKNNGDNRISGWKIEFDLEGEISNIWCSKIVSHSGNHYVIEAETYNKNVPAGGEATFGFCANKKAGKSASVTNIKVTYTK